MQLNFIDNSHRCLDTKVKMITKSLVEMLVDNQSVIESAIPWASPVPVFGDILNARFATLAINPSNLEFTDSRGNELAHTSRRFPTLQSLKISNWSHAGEKEIEEILIYCQNYFFNNPYKRWFNELEYLTNLTNASYYTETTALCHLDLVPFATKVKWSKVPIQLRRDLLEETKFVLDRLLLASKIEALILNGQMVVDNFCLQRGISLKKTRQTTWDLPRTRTKCVPGYSYEGKLTLKEPTGSEREITILGYNHNIQSSFGVSKSTKNAIRNWIKNKLGTGS